MKKQKSSIIVLTSPESSGEESEKAMPKIDKEELRKYLQNSDEEDESVKKTSSSNTILQDKPTKPTKKQIIPIQKDSSQKYISSKVMISKDFKKRQKNLAPHLLIILKEKITNTWLNTTTKRFTSVLPTLKIT